MVTPLEERELVRRQVLGAEAERRRIARELHDGFNQDLVLIAVELELLAQTLGSGDELAPRLKDLGSLSRRLLDRARRMGHDLHPAHFEILGLERSIQDSARELENRFAAVIELIIDPAVDREVPVAPARELYCIAQEALRNAMRHGRAARVQVVVELEEARVTLSVEDDGIGFEPPRVRRRGGLGLVAMEERAAALGGELRLTTAPGKGTTVWASLPLPPLTGTTAEGRVRALVR
ncbi:MAG: ATP-binding protein [Acidobacteriota bacterium]